jgi:osmotically-inducible protein OsmY
MKTKTSKINTPRALFQRISSALETSPYVPHRKVRFETASNGSIVLRGHVESFFQKQMAQETLRRVDGVEGIENHLEVNWA